MSMGMCVLGCFLVSLTYIPVSDTIPLLKDWGL
jgi:hypothetical protein